MHAKRGQHQKHSLASSYRHVQLLETSHVDSTCTDMPMVDAFLQQPCDTSYSISVQSLCDEGRVIYFMHTIHIVVEQIELTEPKLKLRV